MLLDFLRISSGAPCISDLKYSSIWKQVLICVMTDRKTCELFSISDWQQTLLYLKGKELHSDDYREYLDRLIQ